MEERLNGLFRAGFFVCPNVSSVTPSTIPDGWEYVEIISGGKVFFNVDGCEKIFTRGSVFWHEAGEKTVCKTEPGDPYRCYVICFGVKTKGRPGPRISIWDDEDEACEFASECVNAVRTDPEKRSLTASYAYSLITFKSALKRQAAPGEIPEQLSKILKYIENNFSIPIGSDDVSSACGISRPYLFSLFRRYMKKTPHQYILSLRMEKAKTLLSGTAVPIKEIAGRCGFESVEVFYRRFRSSAKSTPRNYREKYSAYPGR